jgi:hypothetical protein
VIRGVDYGLEIRSDLTYSLVKEIWVSIEELDQNEKTEYKFG